MLKNYVQPVLQSSKVQRFSEEEENEFNTMICEIDNSGKIKLSAVSTSGCVFSVYAFVLTSCIMEKTH